MPTPKPKLLQRILEIRYNRGWRFFDRCGEILYIFEQLLPTETGKTWLADDIGPAGAKVKCPELDVDLTFSAQMLHIEQSPAEELFDLEHLGRVVYATIAARLDLREVTRMGFRQIWLVGTDSIEEAEHQSIVRAPCSGGWPVLDNDAIRSRSVEVVTTYESHDHDRGVRFAMRPGFKLDAPLHIDSRLRQPPRSLPEGQREALIQQLRRRKQLETGPQAGVLVDVDYYLTNPKDMSVQSFLRQAVPESDRFLSTFLGSR